MGPGQLSAALHPIPASGVERAGWVARQKGVFHLIFSELTRSDSTKPEEVLMVAATDVKAYRTASSLKKGVLHLG